MPSGFAAYVFGLESHRLCQWAFLFSVECLPGFPFLSSPDPIRCLSLHTVIGCHPFYVPRIASWSSEHFSTSRRLPPCSPFRDGGPLSISRAKVKPICLEER